MKYICKNPDCSRGKEPMDEDRVLRWECPPVMPGGKSRVLVKCPYCRGRLEKLK